MLVTAIGFVVDATVVNKIALGSLGHFLAQSVYIKLASLQAAQLSLFYRKISSVSPP